MLQLWDINLFDSVHLINFYFLNGKVIKFIKINIWKKEFKQSMSSCSIFFSNLIFLTVTLIKIKIWFDSLCDCRKWYMFTITVLHWLMDMSMKGIQEINK